MPMECKYYIIKLAISEEDGSGDVEMTEADISSVKKSSEAPKTQRVKQETCQDVFSDLAQTGTGLFQLQMYRISGNFRVV